MSRLNWIVASVNLTTSHIESSAHIKTTIVIIVTTIAKTTAVLSTVMETSIVLSTVRNVDLLLVATRVSPGALQVRTLDSLVALTNTNTKPPY